MLGLAGKSLGWFLAGVAVALGFLLVPLQVAAERKKLDRTIADIAKAHRDIDSLKTEFDTRASFAQLDRWNNDALHMVAPTAEQFVADEAALASLDVNAAHMAAASAPRPPVPTPSSGAVPPEETRPVERPARVETAAAEPRRRGQAVALLDRSLLGDSMIGDLRRGAQAELGSAR